MQLSERVGNIPFASIISSVIVFAGVVIFCVTLYRALTIVLKTIMEELFLFSVSWLEAIKIAFIIIAAVMALFSILLLIFACLATGATRKNVYSGASCIMGGRVSAAFFMIISYILNIVWMGIMSVNVVPILMYLMLRSVCNTEIYSKDATSLEDDYCWSLTRIGIYRNQSYPFGITPPGKEKLCGYTELRRFCDRIEESGPQFCVSYVGAFLICIGMIHFMISLTANYTRIRISKELTEYRDAIDMEELELPSNIDKSSR